MTHLVAIILGFVEGATEFIPVSSSGHLIIFREILGAKDFGGLAFDAVLQLSASLALLVYFWKDVAYLVKSVWQMIRRKKLDRLEDQVLLYAILLGTIPAIIFGLLAEKWMDTIFRNTELVALTLVLGSILFWYAEKVAKQNEVMSISRGIMIGFFQCLALVPGVSRSGATISGGLIAGLNKDDAVRFSFLLSIPILFGAGLKKVFEIRQDLFSSDLGSPLLFGCITAFITSLIAINFLIKYLKSHDLKVFIWYRLALAIIIVFLF
ncbi:MAG: Undecaprenyl-diphosphatase [Patescibacteria group bacterium]|jgi:undecaprenyl-diphosphatase|nr:Undecaprenyl-diphosphatase [Patescibacteria group bacterium]